MPEDLAPEEANWNAKGCSKYSGGVGVFLCYFCCSFFNYLTAALSDNFLGHLYFWTCFFSLSLKPNLRVPLPHLLG